MYGIKFDSTKPFFFPDINDFQNFFPTMYYYRVTHYTPNDPVFENNAGGKAFLVNFYGGSSIASKTWVRWIFLTIIE